MNRLLNQTLSAALFLVTLAVAIMVLYLAAYSPQFEYTVAFGLVGIILALLFIGVQAYAILERMTPRQSS